MAQMSVGVDPRLLTPSVAVERRLPGVARLTQGAEVAGVVGAAVFQREDVVNLLRRRVPAGREAVLAQGVGGDVGGADSAPAGTVAAVDLRVTLPTPVAFVFSLGVGFAEASVGEVRAARLGTRTGRLNRHHTPPLPDMAKPQGTQPMTGLALGLFLLFNHLHHLKGNALNASGVLDTFWRLGSRRLPIQRRRQPPKRPGLLLVGARALHVEVVTHRLHRLILRAVGEEERFEHEPVIVGAC